MTLAAPILGAPILGAPAFAAAVLKTEQRCDADLVDQLIANAFGPGRFAKTAERLREAASPRLDLSFIAWDQGRAVGCVRQWPVAVGQTPALLLGPFAVDASFRRQGLGAALVRKACAAAAAAGERAIVLVGDEPFFGPLGFTAAAAARVELPGPVDPRRVLARVFDPSATPLSGRIRPIAA